MAIDNTKPSFGHIVKRRVGDAVDITFSLEIIALILVKNTQYNQRLGDIWGKVIVFDKRVSVDAVHEFEFEKDNSPAA